MRPRERQEGAASPNMGKELTPRDGERLVQGHTVCIRARTRSGPLVAS